MEVFPGVPEPPAVRGPFRMKDQRTAAEMAGIVVVRGNLCGDRPREALIAIKCDKRFDVHSNGPIPDDAQA